MIDKCIYSGEVSLFPCPTVLVSVKQNTLENILTVSWAGIASSHPEFVTIAINHKRFSYQLLVETKQFCINIPDASLVKEVDQCGTLSGRTHDKFALCGFTRRYFDEQYVLVDECSFHLLCKIQEMMDLGSHTLFIASVEKKIINADISDLHNCVSPIVYYRPNYYDICNQPIGFYGFTQSGNT